VVQSRPCRICRRVSSQQIDQVGDPKAFVDRGGLRRLETEAADAAVRRVREAAYPLIFKLFGSQMPRGKERKRVLARLGEDMAHIEKTLGYGPRSTQGDLHEQSRAHTPRHKKRNAAAGRRSAFCRTHFIGAQIRVFDFPQKAEALAWLETGE
jgi:hypothetical protein